MLKLRLIRLIKEIPSRTAASKLGVSPVSLCDIELGRTPPKFDTVRKMAALYGVPMEALAGEITIDDIVRLAITATDSTAAS